MYLRFTSSDVVDLGLRGGKAVHRGIFGPAYAVRRNKTYPQYLRIAVRDELLWFEDKLPVPQARVAPAFGSIIRRPSLGEPQAFSKINYIFLQVYCIFYIAYKAFKIFKIIIFLQL